MPLATRLYTAQHVSSYVGELGSSCRSYFESFQYCLCLRSDHLEGVRTKYSICESFSAFPLSCSWVCGKTDKLHDANRAGPRIRSFGVTRLKAPPFFAGPTANYTESLPKYPSAHGWRHTELMSVFHRDTLHRSGRPSGCASA